MISIRLSLVGAHVDCRMNTSRPRTFSMSSTIDLAVGEAADRAAPEAHVRGACTRRPRVSGFALPVKMRMRSKAMAAIVPQFPSRGTGRFPRFPPSGIQCRGRIADSQEQPHDGKLRHPLRVLTGTILAALAVILLLVPATGIPQSDAKKDAGPPLQRQHRRPGRMGQGVPEALRALQEVGRHAAHQARRQRGRAAHADPGRPALGRRALQESRRTRASRPSGRATPSPKISAKSAATPTCSRTSGSRSARWS
mgnify:CR=1 FL=1